MTAQLALPLGGWSPDREAQRRALELSGTDQPAACQLLEALGVAEPEQCARHTAALHQLAGDWLDESMTLLSMSPDPASAALALRTLLEDDAAAACLTPAALSTFVSLASQSAFLGRYLAPRIDALLELTNSGALAVARTAAEMQGTCAALLSADVPDEEELALGLRALRNVELARIFFREVQGLATVEVTCREVADLASGTLDTAYRAARRLAAAPGEEPGPRPAISIIGLGKLGARELNFSSDVDLLFVADEVVTTSSELARYGERIVQRTRDLIDRPLHGSRVFRVDLRLRPDGSRGPLIGFPRGLRDYYERLARTWERTALLRARVVAGDREPGETALRLLEPIRHPRNVDPSAVDELRAMKDRIDRHESWRSGRRVVRGWDSKVGRGGIREVEFVVSMFQYLLAGREPSLKGVSTFEGLGRIAGLGLLDPSDAQDLDDAYRFYRRLEHRLQMDEDRQTQRIPGDPTARHRLARRLGFADWAALDARLERHRGCVREVFERTLRVEPSSPRRRAADELLDALAAFMDGRADEADLLERLTQAGFRRPRSALGALRVLWKRPSGVLSAAALLSPDRLPGTLLDAVMAAPDPDAALSHLTTLLTHPHERAVVGYLRAKPAALRSVMNLLGASDFLARRLTRSPWWVDRLLGSAARVLQTPDQLREGWERSCRRARNIEDRLNLLRRFHASQIVRIALAYLEGVIDDAIAAEQLTMLAEFAVTTTLVQARASVSEATRGHPLEDFAVVGMGRLGSREMGFGSDLDLIFVYEGDADDAPHYARLARRLNHFLNIPMPDGTLYQTDLRLRPWGKDGTVVTTLRQFVRYYSERADPWERIALVRGRIVGAPENGASETQVELGLTERFAEAKQHLCRVDEPEVPAFLGRLDEVRTRLLREVARPQPGRYHLKYGRGGLLEIELLAQVHQLRASGAATATTARASAPLRLLDTIDLAHRGGYLDDGEASTLGDAYRFYRRVQNVVRLTLDRPVDAVDLGVEDGGALRRARRILGRHLPDLAEPGALRAAVERHMANVGDLYRRTIRSLTGAASGTSP